MPERFKVVCIPCKALYKCSAFTFKYGRLIITIFVIGLLKFVSSISDWAEVMMVMYCI